MLTILAAALAAAASCAAAADPAALLAANRAATLRPSAPADGTLTSRYAYHAPGMDGTSTTIVDLATGRYAEEDAVGPTTGADGFDGRTAWMRDLSDFVSPQAGGDKRQLAVNEAYRNANLWWRADRGGARIEPIGCGGIRVTPERGKPFEAWFDPKTHLLARIDETQSFGSSTETRFADYRREGGRMLPGAITIITDAAPDSAQTMTLRQAAFSPARPASAYSMPTAEPADWTLPPSGDVTLPFRLLNNHIIVDAKVNGRGPFPFLVDTGGHDIVTPATVKALNLDSRGQGQAGGAGANTVTNGYAHIDSLDAGGAKLRDQTVVTLDFSPVDVEGLQVGGMLGVEFFERFVVRIDYGAKTISFIDPKRFGPVQQAQAGT
ncbi:MAG TPA: retropepsin-like aspartic protease, partial [Sphingomonas sp.]|nr:retropepsin-like aspartic protease [Sphingomonas sp.]